LEEDRRRLPLLGKKVKKAATLSQKREIKKAQKDNSPVRRREKEKRFASSSL